MNELIARIQALPRREIYGDAYLRYDDVVAILSGGVDAEPATDVAPALDDNAVEVAVPEPAGD